MLETRLAGKTTKKRQNLDPSTSLAHAENFHLMLNRETRRAPGPPVAHAQMAWEDVDKVREVVRGTPTDNPGPEQHSPPGQTNLHLGK
jgi:hypothetical protein